MTFREFVEAFNDFPLTTVIPSPPFGAVPSDWTGSTTPPDTSPLSPHKTTDFDLGLPSVTKTGVIKYMDEKRNPILIHLSDGTRLFFPYDAFKKIKGEPRVGKTMSIVLQRRPEDKTAVPSKIQAAYCH